MAILRPVYIPTVGMPTPAVAPRRIKRTMLDPRFYDAQTQQQVPVEQQAAPQQVVQQQQSTESQAPTTEEFIEQHLQRFRDRAAPPVLEPGGRVKSANMELVQPSAFENFYKSLGTITQIGVEQLNTAKAKAAAQKLAALNSINSQNVPGFNGVTLQGSDGAVGSGGSTGGAAGSGLGIFNGDINSLKGSAVPVPASAYQGKVGRGPAWTGGGNINTWMSGAIAVLKAYGTRLSPGDEQAIRIIVQHESGSGSPNLQNNWDSNARKGIPSRGLMQTIQPTFDNNKIPGFDNVWNPIHNIIAAVRYSIRRYGSLGNVPGVKSIRAGRGYRPY